MERKRRVNIRGLVANPDLRRELMVQTIQATQAREGIETSYEQAERAYYVVTEGERPSFFDLKRYRGNERKDADLREEMFVCALRGENDVRVRFDVARQDFGFIEECKLAYRDVNWLSPLFQKFPKLSPTYGKTRSGLNTTDIEHFVRQRWEVGLSARKKWVLFAKGGDFSRFYTDWDLVFDWTDAGAEFKALVAAKYGSATRFVKSEEDYFKPGITWVQTTVLGINARILPGTGLFGVASPTVFLNDDELTYPMLGLMNSTIFDAIARCLATRNWGATAIGSIPVPLIQDDDADSIGAAAHAICQAKKGWDQGNETSTEFLAPWLIGNVWVGNATSIEERLQHVAAFEIAEQVRIRRMYAGLNKEVYHLYDIPDVTRRAIEESLGERPTEILWPQMEGKTPDQKRMEHVWRLLSYAVKRVIEIDDDGVVPFWPAAGEARLVDRVRHEVGTLFPGRDVNQLEVEITNELKRSVKGYRKTKSIVEWLDNVFFEYHAALYRNRPIYWHLASAQGTAPFAFGALVHYHRFDKERMRKLRASYLRDTLEELKREAALAGKEGRADDRVELQAKLEEAQAFDKKLQQVQEGWHEGAEGSASDYRILTPWKTPEQRPKGWAPDIDDGVKVNIEPLEKAGVLRISKVT